MADPHDIKSRKPSLDRKAEILAATLELAFEVGPDHVTTGVIAARLGLTQPAIYKHFPKKKDIWRAVGETLCERIEKNLLADNLPNQTPTDKLRALIINHLNLVLEAPALPEIMVTRDPTGTLNEARNQVQAAMGEYRRAVTKELSVLYAACRLRPGLLPDDAALLLAGALQGLVLRLIVTRDPSQLLQDGERLLELQLSLLINEREPT